MFRWAGIFCLKTSASNGENLAKPIPPEQLTWGQPASGRLAPTLIITGQPIWIRVRGNIDQSKRIGNNMTPPNKSRGCVKSVGVKFGNDQILDMENFDEVSLSLIHISEPTRLGMISYAVF